MRLTMVVSTGLLLLACGPAGKRPEHRPPAPDAATVRTESTGRIVLQCTPAGANVNVDGKDYGSAATIAEKGGLTLPHGLHRIEITMDGYRPFRFELILGAKPEHLEVSLQPRKPPGQ